jgi:hypothetical protein
MAFLSIPRSSDGGVPALSSPAQLIQWAIEAAGVKVEDWSRERFVVEPEGSHEPLALIGG